MAGLKDISPYGICGVAGFILGIVYIAIVCKSRKLNFDDYIYIYVWAALGAVLGAKILYIVVELPQIAENLTDANDIYKSIKILISSGFVFYGGLFGAIISTCIACNYFGVKKAEAFGILTPAMPLAHSAGRIGCAIVGCCYGIEIKKGPGMIYTKSDFAPLGVKLFPVQIVESIGDILIFFLLVYLAKKGKYGDVIIKTYLVVYAIFRFVLEFFRGDAARGKLGMLSTSQWISLIIVLVVLGVIVKERSKKSDLIKNNENFFV